MAKPSLQLVTTGPGETFQSWIDRTNDAITVLQSDVITASSVGDTTGSVGTPLSATLIGSFTANTIIASETLRTNTLAPKIGSTNIDVDGQILATSTNQTVMKLTSSSGARTTYSSGAWNWFIGFQNTDTNSFVMNGGPEGSAVAAEFTLTTDGNLTIRGSLTATEVNANAATATKLFSPVKINGVDFDGSVDIDVSGVATQTEFTLTRGNYLTGNNFNGSAATTWAVDATTTATAGKIVARDGSGNFAANEITATSFVGPLIGNVTGNASSADKLSTKKTINGVGFDGTENITVPINVSANSNNQSAYLLFSLGATGSEEVYTKSNVRVNPSTATISAANFNSTSDITLKENIEPISDAIEKIRQISGVQFNWKESGEKSMGVIAQEIESIFPELVQEFDGKKTVSYGNLVAVLIQAIKELDARTKKS